MSSILIRSDSAPASKWFDNIGGESTFSRDIRFVSAAGFKPLDARDGVGEEDAPAGDEQADFDLLVAEAQKAAFAEGYEQGRIQAQTEIAEDQVERRRLGSAIRRLDADLSESLSQKLTEVVIALCRETMAPVAIDKDALQQRAARLVGLLAQAQQDCTVYFNPKDIARLDADFCGEWTIEADANLAQGDVRVETAEGGISDGPSNWEQVLREALR